MNTVDVLWLNFNPKAPSKGYWCTAWLEDFFQADGPNEERHYQFRNHLSTETLGDTGAIVVIPAEYNVDYISEINTVIDSLPWSVVILASDENGFFPVENLTESTSLWVMTPHFEKHTYPTGTNFMGEFYPHKARSALTEIGVRDRIYQSGFSGQITHSRRQEMADILNRQLIGHYFNATDGFAQGLGAFEYYTLMAESVVVPAPSGPVTPDSFRAYEALEAGAVPILDLKCPQEQDGRLYWNSVLGHGHPLQMIDNWHDVLPVIESLQSQATMNRIFAWWQNLKRETQRRILADVPNLDPPDITVLIPTSPIQSHPSTEIIEQTVASAKFHHPTADIVIMIDGIRPEQAHYTETYNEYIRNLLWLCNFKWENTVPLLFESHQHQANMTRVALNDLVRTPLVLFMEHDAPLVTDLPFDWDGLIRLAKSNDIDVIRFLFESRVHPEHEWLTLDKHPITLQGVPVRRTKQWSQRPHLARSDYYRKIIGRWFPPTGRTMIEDRMHSVAQDHPWRNRIAIYHPEGTLLRSIHLDGRGPDEKFEMMYE